MISLHAIHELNVTHGLDASTLFLLNYDSDVRYMNQTIHDLYVTSYVGPLNTLLTKPFALSKEEPSIIQCVAMYLRLKRPLCPLFIWQ